MTEEASKFYSKGAEKFAENFSRPEKWRGKFYTGKIRLICRTVSDEGKRGPRTSGKL